MYPVDDPGALQYLCMGVAAQMTSSRYVSTKVPVEVIPRYLYCNYKYYPKI